MPGSEIELNLTIPEQSLISLSFADHTSAAVNQWVKNLPLANVGEISRQLYQAIIELNKLQLIPNTRLQLLELLRPPIDYVCQELSKHFLNQSVVLSEKQQKIANLAQAIQIHLATGYKIVLIEVLPQISNEKVRKKFTCAAHRMMSEYGQVLLRANQLYTAIPKNIWLEMSRVYEYSENTNLLKYLVNDTQNKHNAESRIDQIYKQNLLLSCCRPNQLRQNDIQAAYDAFGYWSDYVEVKRELADESVFLINMNSDLGPRYRSLLQPGNINESYGFDTTELVERLNNYLDSINQKTKPNNKNTNQQDIIALPKHISNIALNHLSHAFGILTKRSFKRISNEGSLNLCIGLSASHYFTSGQIEFHTQMLHRNTASIDNENNIFLTQAKQNDAWSEAYDSGGPAATTPSDALISFNQTARPNIDTMYPQYNIPLVNTSPGGYCLQWPGDVPNNIQAGEILSLRESVSQHWSIAVIRWIRHIKQKGTQIGIELLAPSARPCGVQLLQKTGDPSEYLRGMLLPELSAIGQPATLITPRLPFQSGHKVSIKFTDAEGKCQLETRVSATGSFSQFELSDNTQLKPELEKAQVDEIKQPDSDEDFDSLWPTL